MISLRAAANRPDGTASATRADRWTRGPSGAGWLMSAGPDPGFDAEAPFDWPGAACVDEREDVDPAPIPPPQAAVARVSSPATTRTLCTSMAYPTPAGRVGHP